MKVNLLSTLFLLIGIYANAQINMDDSTVQVITYWEKGDKKDYLVTKERTKIKGTVTTSKESSTYTFALTVKDMTEDSYTIELDYKNIGSEMKGDLMESVINLTKDLKIIYKTDENGSFSEVVNWKEIKIYIQKSMDVVRKDSKSNPEIKTIINQLETTISTKEAIESLFVKDIQQFHAFHGAK